MALNLPHLPFKLTPQDMGGVDYVGALRQGFGLNKDFQEARVMPKTLAEKLLAAQLENKINKAKADYAPQMEQANLNHLLAQTTGLGDEHSLRGLRQQLLQQQVDQSRYEQELNKNLFGMGNYGDQGMQSPNNPPSLGNNESSIPSLRDNILGGINSSQSSDQQSRVVNPGNPNMYRLDELYNRDPRARQALEKRGFKQTQTTKYDPKTGVTSVITTSPSGKVTVESNKASNTGFAPLTEKTKSTQQNIVTGVDSAIPSLTKILDMNIPKQAFWNVFSPNDQASYLGISGGAIDSIVAGMGLPKIQSSTDLVKDMVHRKANEGEDHYKGRIRDLLIDLKKRKNQAIQTLNKGINLTEDKEVEETKVLNGKTYHKINGEWHE